MSLYYCSNCELDITTTAQVYTYSTKRIVYIDQEGVENITNHKEELSGIDPTERCPDCLTPLIEKVSDIEPYFSNTHNLVLWVMRGNGHWDVCLDFDNVLSLKKYNPHLSIYEIAIPKGNISSFIGYLIINYVGDELFSMGGIQSARLT